MIAKSINRFGISQDLWLFHQIIVISSDLLEFLILMNMLMCVANFRKQVVIFSILQLPWVFPHILHYLLTLYK